jgi:hypothetical protein
MLFVLLFSNKSLTEALILTSNKLILYLKVVELKQ